MINEPIVKALNSSTYTAIELTNTDENMVNKFFPISAFTDPKTKWYISKDQTPSVDPPIRDEIVYNNMNVKLDRDGKTLFYAKSDSGTPNLVVHIGRPQV